MRSPSNAAAAEVKALSFQAGFTTLARFDGIRVSRVAVG